jgi:hypothetical protein
VPTDRRCLNCRWWKHRAGCVHPEMVPRLGKFFKPHIPTRQEMYGFTRCEFFRKR